MLGLIRKIVGTKNEREIKRIAETVDRINALEPGLRRLGDAELRGKTAAFRGRLAAGEALDELLPEAFAVVREASRRTLGMRHFDVQLIGGIVLHQGKIAEMKTGEGKTLVATLAVYLNALEGKGVHLVTVNDYLARRDSQWMGAIYRFLGLSVGLIQHDMDDRQRQVAYGCDVTYGTNNEYGFDYLRDNMKFALADYVQRELHYAIVDEVDSILIDEARTPLIISGPVEESTDIYYRAVDIAEPLTGRRITDKDEVDAKFSGRSLEEGVDYVANEKNKSVSLTEQGETRACRAWGVESLHDLDQMEKRHVTLQALRAKEFYRRDVDYVLKDGQVIIVDEFTGRLMPGRRWSEGLHQVIEARENRVFRQNVRVAEENQTLATITFQNYFRLYGKLAGMTGTADTEAAEFDKTYKMEVVIIPTNRPLIRRNFEDLVYRTEREKFDAVVAEIEELHKAGRPVLVGTISIEKSEHLAKLLKRKGIRHQVLNAKYHEREAEIISQAGRGGTVTIATNMAGRGTDILLGGNAEAMARQRFQLQGPEGRSYEEILAEYRAETDRDHRGVVEAGGLHIVGTERHESRRIDNQLRGRAGRQGDPGSSRFYLSLEDDLLRIFGSDRLSGLMGKIGMEEGEPIEHRFVTRAIENAQKRVEAYNFEIRKQLLEYDDVMNEQRGVIYAWRRQVLGGEIGEAEAAQMMDEVLDQCLAPYAAGGNFLDEAEAAPLAAQLRKQFSLDGDLAAALPSHHREQLREFLRERIGAEYARREGEFGKEAMARLRQFLMLQIIDTLWKEHLYAMDSLKEGIGLRGYGQKNPLTEYKKEAFDLFDAMFQRVKEETVEYLFAARPVREEELPVRRRQTPRQERHDAVSLASARHAAGRAPPCRRCVAPRPRSDATSPAPAARGRSTRSAAGPGRPPERPAVSHPSRRRPRVLRPFPRAAAPPRLAPLLLLGLLAAGPPPGPAAAAPPAVLLLVPLAGAAPGQEGAAAALDTALEREFLRIPEARVVRGEARERALRPLAEKADLEPADLAAAGAAAGADFLLLGGFRLAEGRVLIDLRLVGAADGRERTGFRAEAEEAGALRLVAQGVRRLVRETGREPAGTDEERLAQVPRVPLGAYEQFALSLGAAGPEKADRLRRALELAPDFPEAAHLLGVELFRQGAAAEALPLLERAAAAPGNAAEPRNNLGVALASLGRAEEARRQFERALAVAPQYAEARLNLARVLGELGDDDEAEAQYRTLVEADPANAAARRELALLYDRTDRPERAVQEFRALSRTHPELAEGEFLRAGREARKARDFERAERNFRRAIDINPQSAPAYAELGTNRHLAGKYAEGAEAFRRAIGLEPRQGEYRHFLGLALEKSGRAAEAEREYRRALELGGPAEAGLGLARIALERGDPGAAVADLRQVLAAKPEDADAARMLEEANAALESRRRSLEERGRFAGQRLEQLEQIAADLSRDNRELQSRLLALAQEKRALEAAAAAPPGDAGEGRAPRAAPPGGEPGRAGEAGALRAQLAALEAALATSRRRQRDLALELGGAHLKAQEWEMAQPLFEEAVELDPASGEAYYGLGEVFFHLGQYERARTMYEKAREIF